MKEQEIMQVLARSMGRTYYWPERHAIVLAPHDKAVLVDITDNPEHYAIQEGECIADVAPLPEHVAEDLGPIARDNAFAAAYHGMVALPPHAHLLQLLDAALLHDEGPRAPLTQEDEVAETDAQTQQEVVNTSKKKA